MDSAAPIPALTRAQMIEVDRAMVEDYGILLLQMMEQAGRHLAHLARTRLLDGDPRGKRVVVLAGTGGNGGGAAGSGVIHTPAVQVAATLTLALPKAGLLIPEAAPYVGELYLADIGVPPQLYASLGLAIGPLFAQAEILRLR